MSGGGGGVVIIRPTLDSGRCTESEFKELTAILGRQKPDGRFAKRDVEKVLKIIREIFNRP